MTDRAFFDLVYDEIDADSIGMLYVDQLPQEVQLLVREYGARRTLRAYAAFQGNVAQMCAFLRQDPSTGPGGVAGSGGVAEDA